MASIKSIVKIMPAAQPHWVGDGFPVRTIFSAHSGDPQAMSPFLLLDYAAPREFPPSPDGAARGVDEHPHRGFETVTIVYQGALEHRDSAGHKGRIGPGDVQWMTAASGVVHEEKHASDFTRSGGTFEVAQLWVNLPASQKMTKPRYQELLNASIPTVPLHGGAGIARIIAGELHGTRGPAHTVTPINLWDVRLHAVKSVSFTLRSGTNTLVFSLHGTATLNDSQELNEQECAVFAREGETITIRADQDAMLLLLNGAPIDEPVVAHGPFVMNSVTEIKQAFQDFQSGRMGRLAPA